MRYCLSVPQCASSHTQNLCYSFCLMIFLQTMRIVNSLNWIRKLNGKHIIYTWFQVSGESRVTNETEGQIERGKIIFDPQQAVSTFRVQRKVKCLVFDLQDEEMKLLTQYVYKMYCQLRQILEVDWWYISIDFTLRRQ